MAANLDMTHGLIYADAVASALSVDLGASRAHHLIEQAAGTVRQTGQHLSQVVGAWPEMPVSFKGERLKDLFDPTPAVQAASMIIPSSRAQAMHVMAALSRKG
jgi:3-carboxy-cis,cis-muconate cycloisomerase